MEKCTEVYYKAHDGRRFETKKQCKKYEKKHWKMAVKEAIAAGDILIIDDTFEKLSEFPTSMLSLDTNFSYWFWCKDATCVDNLFTYIGRKLAYSDPTDIRIAVNGEIRTLDREKEGAVEKFMEPYVGHWMLMCYDDYHNCMRICFIDDADIVSTIQKLRAIQPGVRSFNYGT